MDLIFGKSDENLNINYPYHFNDLLNDSSINNYDNGNDEICNEQINREKENKVNPKNNQLKECEEEEKISFRSDLKIQEEKHLNKKSIKFEIKRINSDLIDKNDTKQEEDETPPEQYTFSKIKNEVFPFINIIDLLKEKFITNDNIEKLDKNMHNYLGKKTRRKRIKKKIIETNKNEEKKDNDKEISKVKKHNRNSGDNIIKGIKSKLLDYLLRFVNEILKTFLNENNYKSYIELMKKKYIYEDKKLYLIKNLSYIKFVNVIKKKENLKFLNLPLKDFLSNNISPKFSSFKTNWNNKIIEKILKDEKNNKIIEFIFNITFGDWLDIFTYKKKFDNFETFRKLNKEERTKIKEINQNIQAKELIEKLFKPKLKNFNSNYYSIYVWHLFNYKRWYFIKKEGKEKKNEDKKLQLNNI